MLVGGDDDIGLLYQLLGPAEIVGDVEVQLYGILAGPAVELEERLLLGTESAASHEKYVGTAIAQIRMIAAIDASFSVHLAKRSASSGLTSTASQGDFFVMFYAEISNRSIFDLYTCVCQDCMAAAAPARARST
ncbi:MAG: hypothetical protein CVV47_02995 [Spirochaetae bacterium HGW-Spirochaetae-3]|jgi:hypothetical protein|nr:MAG: hypothetical protein CVV47_02995 [Spirochaetae bacterium HGW-Spirochaetae-3]